MTEETAGAERSGPLGIVTAVGATAVFGWFYTLALLFSVQVLALSLHAPCKRRIHSLGSMQGNLIFHAGADASES